MRVAGITGPTGAGKTTALGVLRELGAVIIDCDEVYHRLLGTSGELLSLIDARFPGVTKCGVLDRRALAVRVFGDGAALSDLNRITHPFVLRAVREELDRAGAEGAELAAVDAIALFESGISELCDVTFCVTAPPERRIARIMERDGISRAEAVARIGAQRGEDYFKALSTYTLVNNFPDSRAFRFYCLGFFKEVFSNA